jgi:hypothetical protein
VSQPNGTINEKWRIEANRRGKGYFIRSAANPHNCVKVYDGKMNEGAWVCIFPFTGALDELWSIVPA